ncbi:hypothetical protein D9B51_10210 [Corynebacterium diphtheriae]|nr:hypothetical protein D9B51_10210 [Corynebacterium diphtheriae]
MAAVKNVFSGDPIDIARKIRWGRDALAKVTALTQAGQETGRPAFYDNAISTEYSHSVGIKKGTVG